MINSLIVKNFKSVGENGVKLELKPLTILLGPNGSGKSSILEAVGLLSQSIENTKFTTGGNIIDLPASDNIIYKGNSDTWLTFEVYTKITDAESIRLIKICNEIPDNALPTLNTKIQIELDKKKVGYTLLYKEKTQEFVQKLTIGNIELVKAEFISAGEHSWSNKLSAYNKTFNPEDSANSVLTERIFSPRSLENPSEKYIFELAKELVKIIKARLLHRVFLLSAFRGQNAFEEKVNSNITEDSLKVSGVGTQGQKLVPVLAYICSNRKYAEVSEKISKWTSKFGLSEFSAGWHGGDTIGSDYVDDKLKVLLNLKMASHGSKQILSVITQLFWSSQNDIIMIEEPEISLHPNSQAVLVELFTEAICEGKQIIVTTHSEFLPLTLNIPIKKGLLKIEDIAVYHVEKDENGSIVKRLDLTPEGYVKNWVPSFADLEDKLLKEWMETVPEK